MKRLGLLRHAKSDWDDAALRDFDRGLNARGRRGAALIGAHLRQLSWHCDRALASPAERVRLTIAASGLDLETRVPIWPTQAAKHCVPARLCASVPL